MGEVIDLDIFGVSDGGTATRSTVAQWHGAAATLDGVIGAAEGIVGHPVVAGAVAEYRRSVATQVSGLAQAADDLGARAQSSAGTVGAADAASGQGVSGTAQLLSGLTSLVLPNLG